MWNLKYYTNEPIYETETDSQTQKTYLWLLTGRGEEEGGIESLRLVSANYYMQDGKQQGPTVQHRELYLISFDKP